MRIIEYLSACIDFHLDDVCSVRNIFFIGITVFLCLF